jgi:hypothetical protein
MIRASIRENNKWTSILNFFKTTFICFLLVLISLAISKDAQELVLNPLEAIMEKLNRMAVDPFQVIFFTGD